MSGGILTSPSAAKAAQWPREEIVGARAMLLLQAAIWVSMFAVYFASPVLQMNDSQYSMLTAESIIHNHTPDLSSYTIKNYDADLPFNTIAGTHAYQLARSNGRLVYGFGHGTAILSIPFVATMDLVGISPATADGQYNLAGEVMVEKLLAALLMASLVVVFFRTATLMLDWYWSAIIAIGAGLGTSLWSTASRGMWAHTWEMMLGGIVMYLLLAGATQRFSIRPVLLATLLSWMFFVRPVGAIPALAVGIYILICRRRELLPYVVTGGFWLAAFVGYSMRIFGTMVPFYYLSNDPHGMGIHFMQGLHGILLSPSRGIFVYSPVLALVLYLLARNWRSITDRALTILAISNIAAIGIAIATHPEWWGGNSYGPRLMSDAIPWFVLLAILAIAAIPETNRNLRNPTIAIGAVLLGVSIVINAHGALSPETLQWNFTQRPLPAAMLDWSRPQFLAGWVDRP
jgi:hypothetical protein